MTSTTTVLLPVDHHHNTNNNNIRGIPATNAADFVKNQLPFYEEQYVRIEDLRISTTSFNVATKKPPSDMSFLGPVLANQPDLVVIGLQEVDMSASALIREETEAAGPWLHAIMKEVGCDYHYHHHLETSNSGTSTSTSTKPFFLICSKQLVGLMLIVCGRRSSFFQQQQQQQQQQTSGSENTSLYKGKIREVVVSTVATGALGTVANKGAIGIRIACERSNFCFLNCHLAAHQHAAAKRNEDITEILARMNLQVSTAILQDQYVANQFNPQQQQMNNNISNINNNNNNIHHHQHQQGMPGTSGSGGTSSDDNAATYVYMPPDQYRQLQHIFQHEQPNPAALYPFLPKDCDQLIVLGDLNYRVDLNYETAVALCAKNDIKSLLKEDQLSKEVRHPHSPWFEFTDLTPTFLPTYRFDVGTDNYDTSEKKRIPSFTDRILYWNRKSHLKKLSSTSGTANDNAASSSTTSSSSMTSPNHSNNNNNNNSKHLPTVSLFSSIHSQCRCSDHKPIYALMSLPLKSIEPNLFESTKTALQTLVQDLGLQSPELQPSIEVSVSDIEFGECASVDTELKTKTISIKNTSKAVAEIAVLRRALSVDPSDATWLRVFPSNTSFFVLPGATYDLEVSSVADWSSLRWIVNELPFSNSNNNNNNTSGTFTLKSDIAIVVRPFLNNTTTSGNSNNNNANTNKIVHCSCNLRPTCHAMTLDILLRCGNIPVTEAYSLSSRPPQEDLHSALKPQVPKELWFLVDAIHKFPNVPGLFTEFATEQDALTLLDTLSRKSACIDNIVVCAAEQCPNGCTSIYSVAMALVVFLRDLQVSVIPTALFSAAVSASKQGPHAVMKFSMEQLPTSHFNTFLYIMSFLRYLLQPQNTASNELTPQTLAQVFAVILFPLNSQSRPQLGGRAAWNQPMTMNNMNNNNTNNNSNSNTADSNMMMNRNASGASDGSSGGGGSGGSGGGGSSSAMTNSNRAQADDEFSCATKFILSFL